MEKIVEGREKVGLAAGSPSGHVALISSLFSDEACVCVVVIQVGYRLKTLTFPCYCCLMSCLEPINTYRSIYKYSVSRLLLKINEMT